MQTLSNFSKYWNFLANRGGTTLKEISETLDIDRRSVYRWIDIVTELGFPIYDDKLPLEKRKRWKLDEIYLNKYKSMQSPIMNMTLSEVISCISSQGRGKDIQGDRD